MRRTRSNLFRRTSGDVARFELRISKKDMKGEYVELPPVPIRDDNFSATRFWTGISRRSAAVQIRQSGLVRRESNRDFAVAISCGNVLQSIVRKLLYKWLVQCSTEIGMRMTPHNFRHGIATLLLAKSWENLSRAANYLGCSERVLQTYYAWIDSVRSLEETQDLLAEALS